MQGQPQEARRNEYGRMPEQWSCWTMELGIIIKYHFWKITSNINVPISIRSKYFETHSRYEYSLAKQHVQIQTESLWNTQMEAWSLVRSPSFYSHMVVRWHHPKPTGFPNRMSRDSGHSGTSRSWVITVFPAVVPKASEATWIMKLS